MTTNSNSNLHPDQRTRPVAPKRGSQIFSSFTMVHDVPDDTEMSPDIKNESDASMALKDNAVVPQEDRDNIPSELDHNPAQQRQQQLTNSLDLPGGPNYRPLVGGYAAAAYEAARSLHYSTTENKGPIDKDRRHRPSASIP